MCSMNKRKGDCRMIRFKTRRVLAFVLVLMLLLSGTVYATDIEDVPYYSYTYWEGPSRNEAVPMRAMYEATTQINGDSLGISDIKDAKHVTLSPDEKSLYILDSGNSRILVVDTDTYQLKQEIATIPFRKTDYVIAQQVNEVKANTDYVMFWWAKYDETSGDGDLVMSIRDEATGTVIDYEGDAFPKMYTVTCNACYGEVAMDKAALQAEGAQCPLCEAEMAVDFKGTADEEAVAKSVIWQKNLITFNSGDATKLAVEIQQKTDKRVAFWMDNVYLVEAAVLKNTTVGFTMGDAVVLENVNEETGEGVYQMVTTTKVGDQTKEQTFNLIVDGYYQSSWEPVKEALAQVFSGKVNLHKQVTASDFTGTLDLTERTDGTIDVSVSVSDIEDVAELAKEIALVKEQLQKSLLKNTLADLPAVFATDFNEDDLDTWHVDCGAKHDIKEDVDAANDAGSMYVESTLSYFKAQGLYISEENKIYLADTENYRVLVLNEEGYLEHLILKPDDPDKGIPTDLVFKPTRLVMDEKGYLYVVSSGCFYGMLVYDEKEEFLGFHGSYKVESGVLDTIKGWITDLFMTNEKSEQQQKKLPQEIIDISIDSQGLLYTLSGGASGQVKRLGFNGNQTLNHKFGFQTQSGDLVNFSEIPAEYWHKHDQYKVGFAAITVDNQGFSYVVDKLRSRIFMYDEECRVISVFSTGFSVGNQVGTFTTPEAITCTDDSLYVVDFVSGAVTVFELTEYGRLFKEANVLTIDGEYEKAMEKWQQVLKMDANSQRAYEGMGKAMLTKANAEKAAGNIEQAHVYFDEAMKYAELGNDQQTYSQAFSVVQKEWLTNNFWWIFILCLVLVGGVAALLVLSKKRKLFHIKNDKLRVALTVPFHPFQAFQSMKYQKFASMKLSLVFVLLLYLASVSEDLYGGFMYVLTDTSNYNALYTLIGSVGVLLLWVIANWGICVLNEGKGTLKEVFTMSAYSMTPLIVYSVIFVVGSHVLAASESSTFGLISTIMFIYTALLLLIGMTVVHEYTFFKSMKMAILTILGMLLTAFVIFSVVLLTQQFITFFVNIFNEIALR